MVFESAQPRGAGDEFIDLARTNVTRRVFVYKPIWDYDARTLSRDLSAHLLYGATTSAAFAVLTRLHQQLRKEFTSWI